MTKSKLIQLLRTFTNEEFRSFGKFVRSPFFYKDKAVIKLYDSLKTFYPDFNDDELTKQILFSNMYPKRKYSDSQMKYLMSQLFFMSKRYLIYENFGKEQISQNRRLLYELRLRKLGNIFLSTGKALEKSISDYPIRNEAYFNQMYLLQREINAFYSYSDRLSLKRDAEKLMRYQINGFLIAILRSYYIFLSDQGEYDINFNFEFMNIADIIEKNNNLIEPSVLIFYNIFMLRYKNDHTYYDNLLELKNKYINMLDSEIKEYIYESMDNYCVQKIAEGNLSFYDTLFSLSNDEIINGVRFNGPLLSDIFFMNKVEVAAKVKEFEWASDFIENYRNSLNNEDSNEIINFCFAIVDFEKKNYKTSLNLLDKINLHHPLLRFRIRNYTLLNYYELDFHEQAYLMLDAYRHMLEKDTKIEKSRKDRYNAFLSLYQKLLEIKTGNKKIDRDYFKNEIGSKAVFMKEWLLEKVNEL